MSELWQLDATDLATKIASKEVSSVEVLEAHLARVAAVNPKLNAIVRLMEEDARASALAADQAVARGDALGAFHGVPIDRKREH
jgi:amidase